MNQDSNPFAGIVGFWMLIQLASTLALLLGGIYAMYCFNRFASGMERLAAAVEHLAAERITRETSLPNPPTTNQPNAVQFQSVVPTPQPAVPPTPPFHPMSDPERTQ